MVADKSCRHCGAALPEGCECRTLFDQMLFWEHEVPANGVVHHLAVLCYHIQHPHLYSPDGLAESIRLLAGFVEQGWTTGEVRHRYRARLDSGAREFSIQGKPGAEGSYAQPVGWTMTAADVVAGGRDAYIHNVKRWARQTLAALREGNVL